MNFSEFKTKFEKIRVEEVANNAPDKPLASICIQTYQHVGFIRKCLMSILDQKVNFDYEILLGEDASNDGTREICEELAFQYPGKIRFFKHHRANNIAIDGSPTGRFVFLYNLFSARGSYLALCEGDDYWQDSFKLQKQVDFMEKHPEYTAIFTNALILNEFSQDEKYYRKIPGNKTFEINEVIRGGGGLFPTASLLFRNIIKEYPDFMFKYSSGDRSLSLILSDRGKFYFLDQPSCVYRVHSGGIFSRNLGNQNKRKRISVENIRLLNEFDKYSEFEHHDEIKKVVSLLAKKALIYGNGEIQKDHKLYRYLSLRDWLSFINNRLSIIFTR